MTRRPVAPLTPEGRELEKKRAELSAVEDQLAERELELVTLKSELRGSGHVTS